MDKILYKNWMVFSWEDYFFLSHNSLLVCSFFCVGQRPPGLLYIHLSVSSIVGLVQLMTTQSCLWEFIGWHLDISKRHSLTKNTLIHLQYFTPSSEMLSYSSLCSIVVSYIFLVVGLHNSAFWMVILFCNC